jgi:integrase
MGAIFRPRYRGKDGVVRESAVWWIRFRQHGKTVRQSTETTSETKARDFLRKQEGKVALGLPVSPQGDRLTLDEAASMIRDDYAANGRRSADTSLEIRLAHLIAHFGGTARLSRLTTGAIERYKAARLAEEAAPATVNRELAALRRMATLARHQHGLVVPFEIAMLEERNARQGFFEPDALGTVCQYLRPELAALTRAAAITGWRKSELRSRQWPHVDFTVGWLRLEPEETKNRDGRQFPLVPELRLLLEAQRARVEAIQKKTKRIIPWVFCRDDGAPVGDFKKSWATACIKAGFFRVVPVGEPKEGEPQKTRKVPTKIFHDTRRSAVRSLERAGVPRSAAMRMTGHRTEAVYRRYAIVDERMLREAGEKIAAASTAGTSRRNVAPASGTVVALER